MGGERSTGRLVILEGRGRESPSQLASINRRGGKKEVGKVVLGITRIKNLWEGRRTGVNYSPIAGEKGEKKFSCNLKICTTRNKEGGS